MAAKQAPNAGGSFLSFSSKPPKIYITSEDTEFDALILSAWREEGFDVAYLPYNSNNLRAFKTTLLHLGDGLSLGDSYAIVAYESAATAVLEACVTPHRHMVALIAYYPTAFPPPGTKYPRTEYVVHLAGSQTLTSPLRSYEYPDTEPGFAESDLDEFEPVAADLAWSRTLSVIRKAFKIDSDLEPLWENRLKPEWERKDAAAALATMVEEPCVNHVPTLTGGVGKEELLRFYRDHFIEQNPGIKIKLVSRTVGSDRIVDEMVVGFRHSQRMDWILPGVPPTNRYVQVAMVCVVAVRAGKLDKESLYWDQASVLVQIGLLDPKLVSDNMKQKGIKRLPICGVESARKVLDEESVASNQLIPSWKRAQAQLKNEAAAPAPAPAKPQASKSHASNLQTSTSRSPRPQASKPQASKSRGPKTQPPKPQVVRSQPPKPQVVKSQPLRPGPTPPGPKKTGPKGRGRQFQRSRSPDD